MTRYLLMMAMVILTPPKGSGGLPHAPSPAVVEARVWDKLAAALSFVESRNDDRAYNATSGALGRWQMKRIYVDDMVRLKMIMYIDQDYNLCFLPGDKIEDLAMDETDGFVDTTGIVTSIKSKDVVEFYVENPFVKIKDE